MNVYRRKEDMTLVVSEMSQDYVEGYNEAVNNLYTECENKLKCISAYDKLYAVYEDDLEEIFKSAKINS